MICLENINVKYNKVLFENAKIEIPNGNVTTIVGESGIGKTTLLYMIGLISAENFGDYIYNGKNIDLKNDRECSKIRKRNIGYVFQENNLNEKLTIKGNIELSANIAGIILSEEEINMLLEFVNLDYNIDEYPSKMSGGEKQRLAIACALSKKPDLVIADEPTSALDANNAVIIMDIFKKYAHMNNKKVIIATHNSYIADESDIKYVIEDKKIKLVKGNIEKSKTKEESDDKKEYSLQKKFFWYYAVNSSRKDALKKSVILMFLSVAVACTVLSINFGSKYKKDLNKHINEIANNNILVINQSAPISDKKNTDEFLSIEQKDLDVISEIQGIEKIYPLIEFRSFGMGENEYISSGNIVKNHETNYEFNQDNSSQYKQYTVLPYIDNDYMKARTKEYSELENGVFISSSLAKKLNIESLENAELEVEVCVPMSIMEGDVTYENVLYKADYDEVIKKNIRMLVKGILSENFINTYSIYGDDVIYMDYDEMLKLSNAHKSSALIITISDFSMLDSVENKISNINPNFVCISELQDIEAMKSAVASTKNAVLILSSVMFIIVFIFMSVIYVQETDRRKYEFAMLKANGLTKTEVMKLVCVESFVDVLKIMSTALLIMLALVLICRSMLGFTLIALDFISIVLLTIISVMAIYIPTYITLKYVNKFEPAKIMRS